MSTLELERRKDKVNYKVIGTTLCGAQEEP